MVSVVGYGSLLSERSARETVPGLENFRLVRVPGYRRIFNKVGIVFFSRHGADPRSREIASCSTEPDPSSTIICSQFECSEQEYQQLWEREHRFEWVEVTTVSSQAGESRGLMCTRSSDRFYREEKCKTPQEYQQRVGQYYSGAIWRADILPFPRYLTFCLQAAQAQGEDVFNNFLDSSFLADGTTSIRDYLEDAAMQARWLQSDSDYSYR